VSRLAEVPVLPHDAYWNAAVYQAEIGRIFSRSWNYLGLLGEYPEGRHEISIAGVPVSLLRDETGFAARWAGGTAELGCCGRMLFARLQPGGNSLREQLAPYDTLLETISTPLDAPDHRERLVVAANWKGLVENTLDDCHAATVHTTSLQPAMDPDWVARYRPDRHGRNSMMGNDLGAAEARFWSRLARRLPLARHHGEAIYRHIFLFPNLYLATFFGTFTIIHRIDPLGPESSALELAACLPVARPLSKGERALHHASLRELMRKAMIVIAEDATICALAQQGRHFAIHAGLLGTHERRIGDFQHSVTEVLSA
jgi:hypothetical protein